LAEVWKKSYRKTESSKFLQQKARSKTLYEIENKIQYFRNWNMQKLQKIRKILFVSEFQSPYFHIQSGDLEKFYCVLKYVVRGWIRKEMLPSFLKKKSLFFKCSILKTQSKLSCRISLYQFKQLHIPQGMNQELQTCLHRYKLNVANDKRWELHQLLTF
jgi:hypothetical protein